MKAGPEHFENAQNWIKENTVSLLSLHLLDYEHASRSLAQLEGRRVLKRLFPGKVQNLRERVEKASREIERMLERKVVAVDSSNLRIHTETNQEGERSQWIYGIWREQMLLLYMSNGSLTGRWGNEDLSAEDAKSLWRKYHGITEYRTTIARGLAQKHISATQQSSK